MNIRYIATLCAVSLSMHAMAMHKNFICPPEQMERIARSLEKMWDKKKEKIGDTKQQISIIENGRKNLHCIIEANSLAYKEAQKKLDPITMKLTFLNETTEPVHVEIMSLEGIPGSGTTIQSKKQDTLEGLINAVEIGSIQNPSIFENLTNSIIYSIIKENDGFALIDAKGSKILPFNTNE